MRQVPVATILLVTALALTGCQTQGGTGGGTDEPAEAPGVVNTCDQQVLDAITRGTPPGIAPVFFDGDTARAQLGADAPDPTCAVSAAGESQLFYIGAGDSVLSELDQELLAGGYVLHDGLGDPLWFHVYDGPGTPGTVVLKLFTADGPNTDEALPISYLLVQYPTP